jgi:hypothetical protein
MRKSLEFFNFGENIIKWINTICTGRKATIIFGPGRLGPIFNLERGNAQGDVISPFIFNICYQILILKLDLQITKLDIPDPEPREEEYVGVTLPEGHRTKKVFVFADDCNILTSLDSHNLERI